MGAHRHGGSSVPAMITWKATPTGQYQRKPASWASWTVTVLCLTEALTEEFSIQRTASSPRLRLLKRLLVTKKQCLVTTDDSFALQPTLALSCDVHISSSPPPGLVLLDMYEKNPNPFRINSLLAIHFSFCPTVREGGKSALAKSEKENILGLPHPPHYPCHTNSREWQYNQFTRPVLQVAFPGMWTG